MGTSPAVDSTKTRTTDAGERRTSHVGAATTIAGELIAIGDLTVAGKVDGSIQCNGTIFIQATAQVSASLNAKSIVIDGVVQGNVIANDQIIIHKDAKLVGDMKCARIIVEDGAYFKGSIDISKQPAISRAIVFEGSADALEADKLAERDISGGHYSSFDDDVRLEQYFFGNSRPGSAIETGERTPSHSY